MSDARPETGPEADREHERIEERATFLLPEELAAGSDDPEVQAAEILAESDERVAHPEETGAESTQTTSSTQDTAGGQP